MNAVDRIQKAIELGENFYVSTYFKKEGFAMEIKFTPSNIYGFDQEWISFSVEKMELDMTISLESAIYDEDEDEIRGDSVAIMFK